MADISVLNLLNLVRKENLDECEKLYRIYFSSGIEAMCEALSKVEEGFFTTKESVKHYLLKENIITQDDKVYLATYTL